MIRNTLFAAVAVTLYASSALAQDFDNRYYLVPSIGAVSTDSKRDTDNAGMIGLGFGKLLTPNFSLEADINQYKADLDNAPGEWRVRGIDLAGRLFFGDDASGWRPYALLGLGTARSHRDGSNSGNGLDFKTGLGVQSMFTDRLSGRLEAIYRYTQDNDSIPTDDNYADFVANFGLVVALGDAVAAPMVSEEAKDLGTPMAEAPVETAPMEEAPMPNDDDRDGVENSADKCPATPSGEMVSKSTGCPVEEVIDLRGVNFDFDKCTLRSDAVAILNNAVDVLKGHDIVVSVEGHTDSIGSDAYNQKLSECRANVVKTYLDNNGVAAGKISGSAGWGESKPIASNETVEGRAQNRRTELVRQKN
jgi:OOP family OmpA-OmpF porin